MFQESALHIAARNGDLNGVVCLYDGGTDINITDEHGVGTRHWLLRVADVCLRSLGTQANACPLDAKFSRSLYSVTRCAQKSIVSFGRILSCVFSLVEWIKPAVSSNKI